MKKVMFATVVLIGTVCVAHADLTDELEFTSGSGSALFTDGVVAPADPGTCAAVSGKTKDCSPFVAFNFGGTNYYDTSSGSETITVSTPTSALFDGWEINVTGNSSSPGVSPYGLSLGLDVTCVTSACVGAGNELTVAYSDLGFLNADIFFEQSYSGNVVGFASTTATTYFSNTNKVLAETTPIATLGPFVSNSTARTAFGGPGSIPPGQSTDSVFTNGKPAYSLTLSDVFEATAPGANFSADLTLTRVNAVPEPGAVLLFGTVLMLCAYKLRRYRAAR